MGKFRVTLKHGDPGKFKHSSQILEVEASSESTAMQIAINKFKNSNSSNRDKEVDVVKVEQR